MNPSVGPEADRELTDGARYYVREGGVELGLAFIAEFERVLQLLCAHPNIGVTWRGQRRLPMRRFPYSIVYYVQPDELRVVALAHHRRRPGYGAGRK